METPLALQMWTVRSEAQADLPSTLARVKSAGYGAVETAGLYGLAPSRMREQLIDAGLDICGAHAPLSEPSDGVKALGEVAELGAPAAISSLRGANFESADAVARAADVFNGLVERGEELGLVIGYHNHWWEFGGLPSGALAYDSFVELLDPRVILEVDTYWAQAAGVDAADLVQRHSKRVRYLHVKDGPIDQAAPHVAVEAGKMDVPRVLNASHALLWHVVELDECAGDIWQAIGASATYLRGLRGEVAEGR